MIRASSFSLNCWARSHLSRGLRKKVFCDKTCPVRISATITILLCENYQNITHSESSNGLKVLLGEKESIGPWWICGNRRGTLDDAFVYTFGARLFGLVETSLRKGGTNDLSNYFGV